jgi:uncharacterized protein YdaU (DUF1376 family)
MSDKKTDTWMPLWIGSYLADTMDLTTIQHGAYFLLLMAYWRKRSPLPDNDDQLRSIAKLDKSEWKKMRPVLCAFFKVGDGVWWHKRVEQEMSNANARQDAATRKAKAAADKRWSKPSSNAPSMPQAFLEDMHDECPTPSPTPKGINKPTFVAKDVCVGIPPHTHFSDEFKTAAKARPDIDAEAVWENFNDHYPPEKRTLHRWKTWLSNEQAPKNSGAAPSVLDPDSRASVEALALSKGMKPWDQCSEQWHTYKARVRGQAVAA